ncbi:hypothetical protein K440DRAFT_465166, partial [Wilcoxina mikolae CBS 423.85]
ECLHSLRVYNARYDKITDEHSGSLEWLWDNEQYVLWSESRDSALFVCQGKPGSGKSTVTRYYRRHMEKRDSRCENAIIAQFFYSYRDGKQEMGHANMLCAILFHILDQNEEFYFHYQPEFRRCMGKWSYQTLKKILVNIAQHPIRERIYVVLDALDESDIEQRQDIVDIFYQLCSTSRLCVVKIFLSTRPVTELNSVKKDRFHMILMQEMTKSDLGNYADSFLRRLDFTDDILSEAKDYIINQVQGVFLWVRLVKDTLETFSKTGCSPQEIFDFLQSLPSELEGLYERMIEEVARHDERDVRVASKLFPLVIFSQRPLAVLELRDALAVGLASESSFDISPSNAFLRRNRIPQIEKRVIACGGNFVEIKQVRVESETVQLMHQTAREFLLSSEVVKKAGFQINSHDDSCQISCLRYLLLFAVDYPWKSDVEVWTAKDLAECVSFIDDRPLMIYIFNSLPSYIDG